MTIRNCDADPRRTIPVVHPALPIAVSRALAGPTCPMLATKDRRVQDYLVLHRRWRRFGILPRAGGLEDQLATDLEALELVDAIMTMPGEPHGR